jgi:hypothetical protein
MLKRILNIFFLFNFLVATTGVSMTMQECDNMSSSKVKDLCTGKADCKCCKIVFIYSRLANDFTQTQNQKTEIPVTEFSFLQSQTIFSEINITSVKEIYTDTSPPDISSEHSFLQVFRI